MCYRLNTVLRALAAGLVCGGLVAVVMMLWEWWENPGGIFRTNDGTHWQFVLETGWSWFMPIALCGALAYLLLDAALRWWRNQQGS